MRSLGTSVSPSQCQRIDPPHRPRLNINPPCTHHQSLSYMISAPSKQHTSCTELPSSGKAPAGNASYSGPPEHSESDTLYADQFQKIVPDHPNLPSSRRSCGHRYRIHTNQVHSTTENYPKSIPGRRCSG